MGSRKRNRAEKLKEERTNKYLAVLKNCPTSPRKMRLVADMVRGEDVNKALDMLKYSPKEASRKVEKLLLSAIANWQNKNEGVRVEDSNLFIKEGPCSKYLFRNSCLYNCSRAGLFVLNIYFKNC